MNIILDVLKRKMGLRKPQSIPFMVRMEGVANWVNMQLEASARVIYLQNLQMEDV